MFFFSAFDTVKGMLRFLLAALIFLWILSYLPVFISLSIPLFMFNGRIISLWDVIIVMVVAWIIGILPSPFGEITSVIFFVWILSVLGIFSLFPGLSSILLLFVIGGTLIHLLSGGGPYRYY